MKRRVTLLVSLVVVAFVVGVMHWSNQPVVTKLTVQQNVKGADTPNYALKTYQNAYFAGQIPARFANRSSTSGVGKPLFLQQLFAAPADVNLYADQLAIAVGALPAGGLNEVADVQLRSRTPAYVPQTFSWLTSTQGIAFERVDQGYELGVFLVHDQRYVTIVLSGLSDKKTQLTHEMQQLVHSITWQ